MYCYVSANLVITRVRKGISLYSSKPEKKSLILFYSKERCALLLLFFGWLTAWFNRSFIPPYFLSVCEYFGKVLRWQHFSFLYFVEVLFSLELAETEEIYTYNILPHIPSI